MSQNPLDLSVIIVPHNNRQLLQVTLDAVLASRTKYSFEVIVRDNGSGDGSAEMVESAYTKARLLRGENTGFSHGNNVAIKASRGRYVLLLNPDTKVSPGTFEVMLNLMERRPDIGIATCKLVLGNGQIDPACRRSFPTPWVAISRLSGLSLLFPKSRLFNKYNLQYLPEDEEYEIDSCSGAFLLIRRETIAQIGLLDEEFFMYNEDVDWCYRAKLAGWKVYYYPETATVHYKRQAARWSAKAQWEFHRSMTLLYRKHFAQKYPWFINLIAYIGPRVRYAIKFIWSHLHGLFSAKQSKGPPKRF